MTLYHVTTTHPAQPSTERLIEAKSISKARKVATDSITIKRASSEDSFRLARAGTDIEFADVSALATPDP